MAISQWTAASIPDLSGKTAIVTGATSGIGLETARALANRNAAVILAVRDADKGARAAAMLQQSAPGARITVQTLDLGSLASVKAFAERICASESRLELLVNNAGVMAPPYGRTEDGFELQLGTNHLGHFALTGRLTPLLHATQGARVVVVSSLAHRRGRLDFSDLDWERREFKAFQAYGDSKLANLLFAYEFARRLNQQGQTLCVTAAHPGWTASDLARHSRFVGILHATLSQNTLMGALPSLRAACDPDARSGDYFGPRGFAEMRGLPDKVESNGASHDRALAERLWKVSEERTGVSF